MIPSTDRTPTPHGLQWLAAAAAAAPSLLAYNVSPSPTFLNQALAVALWGWFAAASAAAGGAGRHRAPALYGALALVAAAVAWSWGPGALPMGLALSALGLLLAAAVLAAAGTGAHGRPGPARLFGDFCWGWLIAGVLNAAVAAVQVFAPDWTDGDWIATSGIPGRAVGNLRQPNHLSSLLMWSAIAVVALAQLGRIGRRLAAALLALFIFAVVLTASRTGLLSVLMMAGWGAADRRLARPLRGLLLAGPLLYAAAWFGMAEWAALSQHTFGGTARLAEGDVSGSRFGIWGNTLDLIAQQPWAGVGFGEFNFVWTLTPFPGRPVAFFDHTHNLPLQLAVELGLPLAAAVTALLLWALWQALRLAFGSAGSAGPADADADAETGTCRRAAVVMVLMIGLHSLVEYPLWYSYFLLPTAWLWGFALGVPAPAAALSRAPSGAPSVAMRAGGVALVAGSLLAVLDYTRVTAIFSAADGAPPLEQRIASGQRSVLFAHHADYAAATTAIAMAGQNPLQPYQRATHFLLDTRLMVAWAKALAAEGRVDEARFIAARLREFRNPASDDFFAPCAPPQVGVPPFQCEAPQRPHPWRAFVQR